MRFLLEATNNGSIYIIILMAVIIVAMIVISTLRSKKDQKYRMELNEQLKPGAKIITVSGIYGEIVSITETTDGKIVLISTGLDNKTTMELHINAIAGIDSKKPVIYDAEGNDITFANEDKELGIDDSVVESNSYTDELNETDTDNKKSNKTGKKSNKKNKQ